MTAALTRLKTDRPVRWTTLLGILLVPLTVAGVLLWGLWNPTERLENVTAAVVNLDEAVELDGQTVPLGRVLAGELIGEAGSGSDADRTNFTWVLTDADDAEAGVADGRYATVVTIPKSFSADATSLSGDPADATQARIDVTESHRGRLIDTALSNIVTQTATRVLNEQLGEQFIDGVYVGFNTLGDGITDAADGAAQLATGTTSLTDGAKQLDDGAAQLADGTQQLSDGTQQLATGAGTLASGAGELSSGVGQYVAGAQQLADAYPQLQAGIEQAATQLKSLSAGLTQLAVDTAAPQQQLTDGMTAVGAGAIALFGDGTPGNAGQTGVLYGECLAAGSPETFCNSMLATLSASGAQIGGGLTTAKEAAAGLETANANFQSSIGAADESGSAAGTDAAAQLDQLIAGAQQFGTGISQLAAQGGQLTSGAAQLADGATQLSSGTSELAANAPQLADGATQLAEGTSELADGSAKLADGAGDLASGLDTAADEVPTTTDAEREQLAKTAATPVTAEGGSDELFNASGVPLFAGIALWAGALAAFLVLAPLWRRTRDAARGVGYITLRSALPALALGAVQGALAGIVLPIALGYDFGQGARFFGFALLAGIAFALMVQGLSALLGGFGRFIAFALLVVAFAVGIVSTVPGALAAVGDFSPLGSALSGFQSIATGDGSAGGAAVILTLWGALGLVLTAFAVMRARRAR